MDFLRLNFGVYAQIIVAEAYTNIVKLDYIWKYMFMTYN